MTAAAPDVTTDGVAALADDVRFWGALVVGTAARAALLLVACLLLGAALPALWGWVPTTVASGSMSPRIGVGDVVVAMPVAPERVHVGQVLLVDDPAHPGDLLLHRLAAVEGDGMLRLRGDANAQDDASLVSPDAVRGVGVLRVPALGLPVAGQGGDRVAGAAVTALVLLALLGLARLTPRDDGTVDPRGVARHRAPEARVASAPEVRVASAPDRAGGAGAGHGTRPGRRGGLLRASGGVLAVVALVTVLVVVVGSSNAAFSASTASAASLRTATRFTCLDAPPPTAARFSYRYDDPAGTSVRDASGNGRTGTLQPGATLADGSCRPGDSPYLQLDGRVGSSVSTGERITGPQVFTIETWFRTTTTTGGKLVGFGNAQTGRSTQYDRHLYLADSGALVFGTYSQGDYHTVSSAPGHADGTWHLATASLGPDGLALYVDGALVATDPFTRAEEFVGWWRVGGDTINGAWAQYPTSGFFRGDLDDTTVWDRALSATEVAQHFSAGAGARSRR